MAIPLIEKDKIVSSVLLFLKIEMKNSKYTIQCFQMERFLFYFLNAYSICKFKL